MGLMRIVLYAVYFGVKPTKAPAPATQASVRPSDRASSQRRFRAWSSRLGSGAEDRPGGLPGPGSRGPPILGGGPTRPATGESGGDMGRRGGELLDGSG